jgi:hypothetical protein
MISLLTLSGLHRLLSLKSDRLRLPRRHPMAMMVACPNHLVPSTHPVRQGMAMVGKLDLRRFHERSVRAVAQKYPSKSPKYTPKSSNFSNKAPNFAPIRAPHADALPEMEQVPLLRHDQTDH